jgi:hypothetical protein
MSALEFFFTRRKQLAGAPIFRCQNWNIHIYISSQRHLFTCSIINDSESSLWVIQCQCRWSSLGSPVSIPVVLSGLSDVNTGGSLWVLRCQCRWFSLACWSSYFSLSKLKHPYLYLITAPSFYLLNNQWLWNQFTLTYAWWPKHLSNML